MTIIHYVVVDFLFIVSPIVGACNRFMFCCTILYVYSSIAIFLMGKRELVALLNLSFWCPVMVEWLFLVVPWGCLQFVIVVLPDHPHLLILKRLLRAFYICLFKRTTPLHTVERFWFTNIISVIFYRIVSMCVPCDTGER